MQTSTNVNLVLLNRTANHIDDLVVSLCSVEQIVEWYSAFCAGDDYDVLVDNVLQDLDHNGQIKGNIKVCR